MQQSQTDFNKEALKGLQAFNRQAFYDAHEYFETAWRNSPLDEREFYRSLLQISGGFYRLTEDRPTAAYKFFDRARFWLRAFPPQFKSMDVDALQVWLDDLIKILAEGRPANEILHHFFHPIDLSDQEVS